MRTFFLSLNSSAHLRIAAFLTYLALGACSSETSGPEEASCRNTEVRNISFQELHSLYAGEVTPIQEEAVLEGIVISSDREGNIFGSLYIQDQEADPKYGIEIRTDLLDIHTRFPEGSRIRFSLSGTFLDTSRGGWSLGAVREVFGNTVLDRIPALETLERIELSCQTEAVSLVPRPVSLADLDEAHINTLVQINGLEVSTAYPNGSFAEAEIETRVPLETCTGSEIVLVNSGYSDFYMLPLPEGSGSATGILMASGQAPELLLRSAADLAFDAPSCDELFPPARSTQILISELADPDNESGARFLELYNAGSETIDLKGWRLVRYTNANEEAGGVAALDGLTMAPGSALVFSANPEVFERTYGMAPDAVLRANGPADSNGDDNIVLLNPFDEIVDTFGVPGEDGSGTAHEFEDGRALRRSGVLQASPVFEPSEWILFNDTGREGTIQRPLTAPGDYSPGRHPDPDESS